MGIETRPAFYTRARTLLQLAFRPNSKVRRETTAAAAAMAMVDVSRTQQQSFSERGGRAHSPVGWIWRAPPELDGSAQLREKGGDRGEARGRGGEENGRSQAKPTAWTDQGTA